MKRTLLIYIILLLVFGAGIYAVLVKGRQLSPPIAAIDVPVQKTETSSLWSAFRENFKEHRFSFCQIRAACCHR
jgi:hypothetical protein